VTRGCCEDGLSSLNKVHAVLTLLRLWYIGIGGLSFSWGGPE
jgi:hypothetical protein